MERCESLLAIDSHTLGEPTRIIVEGFPEADGATMMEKKLNLQKNYDHLRRAVIDEPRGHRNMFGAIIMKPTHKDADLGVVFMDSGGYLNMCGHGSIGVATVAVARRLVPVTEPYTSVCLESPAGLIRTRVRVEHGKVKETTIVNVPSFLYRKAVDIHVPGWGTIQADIAFGGNFFALVDSRKMGLPLQMSGLNQLIQAGAAIRKAVNQQVHIFHPLLPDIRSVDLVEFYQTDLMAKAMKNIVVFGDNQVDRSPCGTGTSAKIASLYAQQKLIIDEPFISESITGTKFIGRALKVTTVGSYPAIIPEITGRAYLTGENKLIFDHEDPFEYGFNLADGQRRSDYVERKI
ncbi:proline racemase family protein [Sporolactobacillus shoreicorticis]|uniref:Proline racemase family protein n=1 Tax=Sporolactobacillus shoreicorticis TaxID=1923877 RepID=A0ABW5RYZ7_9BACL|nr:proline racemase family protein [Sporolactobacillus shoreicorticis]MCO7127601.1 proline racemase family protein [Sporolactobacillus shoreicorticis]